MRGKKVKQLVATMLCLVLLFSLGTNVQAATVPSESNNYLTEDTLQGNYPEDDVYEASWLLGKFNTVTWNGGPAFCHLVGPVLSQGPVSASGGFSNYTNGVSSYLAGTGHKVQSDTTNVYREPDVPFPILYIGTENKPIRFVGNYVWTSPVTSIYLQAKDYDDNNNSLTGIYSTDAYVEWLEISRKLIAQSGDLCTTAASDENVRHITMAMVQDSSSLTNHKAGYYGVDITIGETVYIDPGVVNYMSKNGLHFYLVGNFESADTTLINIPDDGALKMPGVIVYDDEKGKTAINSDQLSGIYGYGERNGTVDYDENGTSVVWNMSNATQITYSNGTEGFGHAFAPNAYVDGNSGSYNGGFVCKSVNMPMTEIHMFPMKGSLTPKETENPNGPPYPVDLVIPIQKTLYYEKADGTQIKLPEMVKGAYKFTLEGISENTKDVKVSVYNDIDGKTSFEPIVFNANGEYKFKLTEEKPLVPDADTTYDETIYYITVTITTIDVDGVPTFKEDIVITKDDGTGVSGQAASDTVEFTNITTKKTPASAMVNFTKTLEDETGKGPALKDGEFEFILEGVAGTNTEGESYTTANKTDIASYFTPIEYTTEGTYKYTLKEKPTQEKDIEIDPTVYNVEVVVTDPDNAPGVLAAEVKYYKDGNEITDISKVIFKNIRKNPTPISNVISFKKELQDSDKSVITSQTAGEFKFSLTGKAGTNTEGKSYEAVNTATGAVNFPAIEYTEAGTYEYTLKEVADSTDTETKYDTSAFTVQVEVEENTEYNNLMVKSVKFLKDGKEVSTADQKFVNTRVEQVPDSVKHSIKATKVLQNEKGEDITSSSLAADEFIFTLTNESNYTSTATNKADGTVAFPELEYTEAGTFVYTLAEKRGADSKVTYDTAVYTVTVVIKENTATNKLEVESVTYKKNNADVAGATFTNVKDTSPAPATAKLEANKIYKDSVGNTLPMQAFNFNLFEGGRVIQMAQVNTTTNKVTFNPITYTEAGTHTYIIKEIAGADADITYDATEYTVTVEVTEDAANNKLVATVKYPDGKAPTFTNTKTVEQIPTPTNAKITLNKQYKDADGNDIPTMLPFKFNLVDKDGNVVKTATVDSTTKTASFSIAYDKAGTYVYTIEETDKTDTTITYDDKKYEVTVVVTETDNKLSAVVTYKDGTAPTFINTKTVEQIPTPTNAKITLNKQYKDADGNDIPTMLPFKFNLVDKDGNVVKTATVDSVTKAASFSIDYDKAGTYVYTIEETDKTDTTITYDDKKYEVTVVVTETDNKLSAVVTYKDGTAPTFVNTKDTTTVEPEVDPVVTDVTLNKLLYKNKIGETQIALQDKEFEFVLEGVADTNTAGAKYTATNDANGVAKFTLTHNAEGVYIYNLTETQKSNDKTTTYDTRKYTVTITVSKVGNKLQAAIKYTDESGKEIAADDVVFKNVRIEDPGTTEEPTTTEEDKTTATTTEEKTTATTEEKTTEVTTEEKTTEITTEEKTTEEKNTEDDKESSSDKKDDETSSSDKKDDETSSTVKTDNSAKTADTASIFLGFILMVSAAGACVVLEILRRRNSKREE